MEKRRLLLVLLAIAAVLVVVRACEYQERGGDGERQRVERERPADAPAPPLPDDLPPVPPSPEANPPSSTVVGEDIYDGPDEASVRQIVVVEGPVPDGSLRALLLEQYRSLASEASFSHFDAPTDVTITVYGSREEATSESERWLARLQMDNRGPLQIDVRG